MEKLVWKILFTDATPSLEARVATELALKKGPSEVRDILTLFVHEFDQKGNNFFIFSSM